MDNDLKRSGRGQVFCGAGRRGEGVGLTCHRGAGHGTNHVGYGRCSVHGGSTPSHVVSSQVAMARDYVQLYGSPRKIHPLDGLLEDYYRSTGLVDAYEAMCMQLLPADVVWGVIGEERAEVSDEEGALSPAEIKRKYGAVVSVWVKMLNDERDRRNRLGEAILRLDIDSRRAEFQQSQVAALVAVLLSPELGLDENQRRAAARILRGLENQQAIEGSVAA